MTLLELEARCEQEKNNRDWVKAACYWHMKAFAKTYLTHYIPVRFARHPEGNMPYTPTRLEWLALDLNACVPSTSIKYYTTGKANTIAVYVFYDSTTSTLEQRKKLNGVCQRMHPGRSKNTWVALAKIRRTLQKV